MPVLNREAILGAYATLKYEDVDCPEWGGVVRVRELTAGEREDIQIEMTKKGFGDNGNQEWRRDMNARLVCLCAIDESKQQIFQAADIEALSQSSGAAVLRLAEKIQEISGLFPTEKKRLTPRQIFNHRLALSLGMTVTEMLDRMPSSEHADWEDYWEAEPFGPAHEALTLGGIAAVIYNCFRAFGGNKSASPPLTPADFVPKYTREPKLTREQEIERDKANLESLRNMANQKGSNIKFISKAAA